MRVLCLAALLISAAGCDCGEGVVAAEAGIRVEPVALDFGGVPIGDSTRATIEVNSSGIVPLTIESVALAQEGDGAIRIDGVLETDCDGSPRASGGPLRPGTCAAITLTFAPIQPGPVENVLRILSDAAGAAVVEVPLRGEGLAPTIAVCVGADASESCSRLDDAPPFVPALEFGEVPRRESVLRFLQLRNTGRASLRILSARVDEGTEAFALTPASADLLEAGLRVTPGGTTELELRFTPPEKGDWKGRLVLATDDPAHPEVQVALHGIGLGPSITVCVESVDGSVPPTACTRLDETPPYVPVLDFGPVVRRATLTRKLRVRNDGRAPLKLISAAVSGSGAFKAPALSATLAPGEVADLPVSFAPATKGAYAGTVRFTSDDPDHPQVNVPLRATGTAPAIKVCVPTDAGAIDPARCSRLDDTPPFIPTVDLGSVLRGGRASHALRILDAGDAPLAVASVTVRSGGPVVTVAAPGVPRSLAPAASFDVTVTAAPTVEGPIAGLVRIVSDDDAHPKIDVPVSAAGVAPQLVVCVLRADGTEDAAACSRLRASPPFVPVLDFGTLAWGQRSTRVVRIRSAATAPLSLSAPALVGTTGDFALGTGAGAGVIAPGSTRDVQVVFAPVTDGAITATLRLKSDDQASPDVSVPIKAFGDGQKLCASPATLDFGSVRLGLKSTKTVDVTNCGGVPVNVTSWSWSGPAAFVAPAMPGATQLAVGAKKRFTITYEPKVRQQDRATITATTARTSLVVPVTGLGGPPVCEFLLGAAACADTGSRTVPTNPQCHEKLHLPFETTLKWRWPAVDPPTGALAAHTRVIMTPLVADIDRDASPDVVFTAYAPASAPAVPYYLGTGALVVLNGTTGRIKWMRGPDTGIFLSSSSQIAIGDLDNDGRLEIVALRDYQETGSLYGGPIVFSSTGTMLWSCYATSNCVSYAPLHSSKKDWGGPSLADLDHDGLPEIIHGATVYKRQANGSYALLWNKNTGTRVAHEGVATGSGDNLTGPLSVVADVDQDGTPEILTGTTMYRANGTVAWNVGQGALAGDTNTRDGFPALGDFDADGQVDIVVVTHGSDGKGQVLVRRRNGTVLRGPVGLPSAAGDPGLGGPPTVADFDGDGRPEIGVAGRSRYTVFDTDLTVLWSRDVQDHSSSTTGSSVFDFEGDGFSEVVYGDEAKLHVYDGATGAVLFEQPNPSATAYEYPVIADVDADGKAEIVVAANPYGGSATTGVSVWAGSSPSWSWVPTRQIWNQHAYSVTNVHESGHVTSPIPASWQPGTHDGWPVGSGGGSFRANAARAPAGAFKPQTQLQLDTIDIDPSECPALTVRFWIDNRGLAAVPAGATVSLYRGTTQTASTLLEKRTLPAMAPGASIRLALHATGVNPGGTMTLVVNPGAGVQQCAVSGNGTKVTLRSPCE